MEIEGLKVIWTGNGDALVDSGVEYIPFEVLKPLGKGAGFDSAISMKGNGVTAEDDVDLEMATVLEGYLAVADGL